MAPTVEEVRKFVKNSVCQDPKTLIMIVELYFGCSHARAEEFISDIFPDYNLEDDDDE